MRAAVLWALSLAVWTSVAPGASVATRVETYPLAQTDLAHPEWVYLSLMQWSEKPPAGVEALAKGERERVWYGEMRLGDGKPMTIAIAMVPPAQAKPEAPLAAGSCRICLDLNGNCSLTDEDPLVAVKQYVEGRGSMLATPEVKVPVTYALKDGSQVQHDYCFRLVLEPQATYKPMLAMMISSAWTGTIRLGDRNVAVRVSDTSGNAKLRVASPTAGNTITLPPEQTQGAPPPLPPATCQ